MKAIIKANERNTRCRFCILRTGGQYNCEFDQWSGNFFDKACSEHDYIMCSEHKRGEQLIKSRGW